MWYWALLRPYITIYQEYQTDKIYIHKNRKGVHTDMPSKKTQTKKRASTGKSSAAARKKVKPEPQIDKVWSILLFGIALILFLLTYMPGQAAWNAVSGFFFGVFGIGMYIFAPAVLVVAVLVALGKPFKIKTIQLFILLMIFCAMATVFCSDLTFLDLEKFKDQFLYIWAQGKGRIGGGVLAIPLGLTLLKLCGSAPAKAILIVLIVIIVMLVTNITPVDIFIFFKKRFGDIKDTAKTVARESVGSYEIDLNAEKEENEVKAKRGKKPKLFDAQQAEEEALHEQQKRLASDAINPADEPNAPFDIDLGPAPTTAVSQMPTLEKPIQPPLQVNTKKVSYDEELPFTRTNTAPLPKEPEGSVKEAENIRLITDILAHDKLAGAGFEAIAKKEQEISLPETEEKTNDFSLQGSANENTQEENNDDYDDGDEVDELVRRAVNGGVSNKADMSQKEPTVPVEDKNSQMVMPEALHAKTAYILPGYELLTKQAEANDSGANAEMKKNAKTLVSTLESFGVKTKILDICRGPSVTRYELQPLAGVKISRITNLSDDIALNLATAGVRIEAPIPGKPAVGIEVPNANRAMVRIRSVLECSEFEQSKAALPVALGKDISGQVQITDLSKMPHLLIAGTTGSGKSVCTNGIILSLLYRHTPEDLKFILIDPKVVEFSVYNGIPHLAMPVITEPRKAAGALGSAVAEMEKRYLLFAQNNVRDINGYNKLLQNDATLEKMPYIVIVIDEMADLMMTSGKEVEDYVCRLAQKARAAGMHLIVATQRPSVDVITGLIKANIPSRIALSLSSQVDSRTIIDSGGAEKLLGNGDMLFLPVGANKPVRIQGAFVSDSERDRVVSFIKTQGPSNYNEEMIENTERIATSTQGGAGDDGADGEPQDEMLVPAIEAVIDAGQASTSMLQRRLRLGYGRAGRLIDEMERMHIIGPYEGAKPRQVLITRQQWIEMNMNRENEN